MELVLYHTVRNDENADEVEKNAPFYCSDRNAWLGSGYYFWDTFIDLAHWWGELHCNNNYFICETVLQCDEQEILDLVGNTRHMLQMQNVVKTMEKLFKHELTAQAVFKYMRYKCEFSYKAIRVNGILSMKGSPDVSKWQLKFNPQKEPFLDLMPSIQVCVIDKSIIKLPLKIIYPEEYCEGYVV